MTAKISAKDYWLHKLSGDLIKAVFPREPGKNTEEKSMYKTAIHLSKPVLGQLSALTGGAVPRLLMVFTAAVSLLMERYTGLEDIVVGTPVLKQDKPGATGHEKEGVNRALALRIALDGDWSFKQLLLQVRQTLIDGIDHGEFAIEALPAQLNMPYTPDQDFPLFDTAVLVENIQARQFLEPLNIGVVFSFRIIGESKNLEIQGELEYDGRYYGETTIQQLIAHFTRVLDWVTANPELPLKELVMLCEQEKEQLLVEFNRTLRDYPTGITLHGLFRTQAKKTPDHTALYQAANGSSGAGEEKMTYGELNRLSDQLALVLRQKGVGPGMLVGLMAVPSLEMAVGLWGLIKAGGAYLPLDPDLPGARLEYMLVDSGVSLLVKQCHETVLGGDGQEITELCIEQVLAESVPQAELEDHGLPSDAVYVVYTSGTTGKPKGVLVEHQSVVNTLIARKEIYHLDHQCTSLQLFPFIFDGFVTSFFTPLISGAEVVMLSREEVRNTAAIYRALSDYSVTHMLCVPSLYRAILETPAPGAPYALRVVTLAGEPLPPEILPLSSRSFPEIEVVNEYGVTEAAVMSTLYRCRPQEEMVKIGKPTANTRIYILDKKNRLTPPGVAGELCIAGCGIARGYLNNPELTAARFQEYPLAKGQRMYHTGDMARWLPCGNLQILGRDDYQVKIRGNRVECGEIEHQLHRHENIKEAVVLVKEEQHDVKTLCAFLVTRTGTLDIPELKRYLSLHLPTYMVPAYFLQLQEIPKGATGKIDRAALKKHELPVRNDAGYVPPVGEVEEKLVRIWQEVLDIKKIGVKDNFFAIGGDSIKTINLLNRINNEFHTHFDLVDLHEAGTVQAFAPRIRNYGPSTGEDQDRESVLKELIALKKGIIRQNNELESLEDIFPMSDIEKGMAYCSLRDTGLPVYHIQLLYRLKDKQFQASLFTRALALLVDKHTLLRTGFNMYDFDEPVHLVYKTHQVSMDNVSHEDISYLKQEEQTTYIKNYLEKDKTSTFRFQAVGRFAPLWRMKTFKLDRESICMVWSCHHSLMDGWSNSLLKTEIYNTYLALKKDAGYVPPGIRSGYKEFVINQLIQKKCKENEEFWQQELAGYKRFVFPQIDTKTGNEDRKSKKTHVHTLGIPMLEELKQVSRNNNISVKHLCFAAYAYMLYMLAYENDLVTGLVASSRPSCEDGDKLVGCFLNTIPVRIPIPAGPGDPVSWRDYFVMIDERIRRLTRYAQISLFRIVEIIGEKTQHSNPISDTVFNYVDFYAFKEVEQGVSSDGILLEAEEDRALSASGESNTLFDFSIDLTWDEFIVSVFYSEEHLSTYTVQRLCTWFETLLIAFIREPEQAALKEAVLSEKEKQTLLHIFNRTKHPYPDQTIHGLFERQVENTPHRVALIGESGQFPPLSGKGHSETATVTYAFLDEQANRLALRLRARGLSSGTIVGIMTDHSLEMVIGLLGILKAGCAFLPIDPGYPARRVVAMLNDCRAPVLLSKNRELDAFSFTALQSLQDDECEIYCTGRRQQITGLDDLPFPDRSLVNYEAYVQFIGLTMFKHTIALQASRGCPYNCAYCHKIWPKTHEVRSPENILQEVKLYYDMGVRRFAFIDDIFNLNKEVSTRFFQLVIQHGLEIQLFFPNGFRGDILTREFIDLAVKAGTVNIALSLETASPRLQKLIRKNLDLEKLRDNIRYIAETYPQVILELQTMHGFPTETEEEARMTLEFVKSIQWIHFPYLHILKIYPNTDMERLALANGVSARAIRRSSDLAYHELPETLPFDREFTLKYQAEFFNDYFMNKERLLHLLPHQLNLLSEDELVQKYDSYLPVKLKTLDDLLRFVGITRNQLNGMECTQTEWAVPGLHRAMTEHFQHLRKEPTQGALNVLLLDLSQFFTGTRDMLYDVVEPPLGLMNILTYLNRELGEQIHGKIAKSRIDFDSYEELKALLLEFKPDIIGVRTLTFYKDFFHRTISILRQWGVQAPVIAGGPYATSDYISMLRDGNVDLAVLGEGEVTFCQVIRAVLESPQRNELPGKDRLKQIPGLAFAEKNPAREVLVLDAGTEANNAPQTAEPVMASSSASNHGSYVIYTSGSTGNPRGVMVEHRALVNLCTWHNRYYEISPQDRATKYAGFGFDASVWEIFPYLIKGAALAIIPGHIKLDIEKLEEYFDNHQVTVSFLPTQLCEQFLLTPAERGRLASLRLLLTGGDKLYRFQKRHFQLHNNYGPTENTVVALSFPVEHYQENIPVGRPIDNNRVYILDREGLHIQPIGVPGELCIAGDSLARGYLNKPEATDEKFIRHTGHGDCTILAGERLYRTGDRARWLEDGNIEFLGRLDLQVKIRGHRIELAEIEGQLLEHDAVNEAVVVEKQDQDGDKYLCAYVVPTREFDISSLKEYLLKYLPAYMIPVYFIELETIPLTPNSKVDKKALPEPGALRAGPEYVAPMERTEEKLIRIWAEVLNIEPERIGIHDNFFELGGHSLRATQLISKIHKVFQVKVVLEKMFRKPTVKKLAQEIKQASPEAFRGIEPSGEKECYALSSAQRRLYAVHQMEPDNIRFNMPVVMEVTGPISKQDMEYTFLELIRRHEILRTFFILLNKEPVQKIHREAEIKIEYFEIDREADSTTNSIITSFIRPFNLEEAPLMRAGMVKLNSTRHILLLDMHHIITDGVSQAIFFKEFMALYHGEPLPPCRLQYKDFSQWQNSEKGSRMLKKQEEYWLEVYNGDIPVLELPTDYVRPRVKNFAGERVNFQVPAEWSKSLRRLGQDTGTTLFMVLLALYYVLLAKYSRQSDIIVGSPITGRRHEDLQNIMGMFVNMLALRSRPEPDIDFKHFLLEVKGTVLDAMENQDFQFDELVDHLGLQGSANRNPLFNVVFAMQNIDMEPIESEDLTVVPFPVEYKISRFDLTLFAVESADTGGIDMSLEYSTELFTLDKAEKITRQYLEILEQVHRDPAIVIKDIILAHNLLTVGTGTRNFEQTDFNF